MTLTDLAVRRSKATGKDRTLTDFDGLSLFIAASGGKSWHFRYYWLGKQKRMSFGTYPAVTLAQARKSRDEARTLLRNGINPRVDRKRRRQMARMATKKTFKAIYEQWLGYRGLAIQAGPKSTLAQIQRGFERDVLPSLGRLPVFEVTRPDLLEVIDRIERRNAFSVAEKVRTWLWQLFGYAVVSVPGLDVNPAVGLELVAAPLPPVRHNPFLRLPQLPMFLRSLRDCPCKLGTQFAIRLLLLTGVRTGELRHALPAQFNLKRGVWIIPPSVVKQIKLQMRRARQSPDDVPPYIVPLSTQATEIVRYLLTQVRPQQRYLLAGARSLVAPISENAINMALKRMGYKDRLTGHGIRATISTALHEIGYPSEWIDAELSHADRHQVSGFYNHAEYVEQRRVMMQDWADRLNLLERGQLKAASRHLSIHLKITTLRD